MTDAGEKLEARIDEYLSNDADADEWGENVRRLVLGATRDELERAAEIADYYAKQMFGEKVDAEDLAVEIATAIRKLKE